ncbi:MAG TPA: CoA pyrophosphatase [Geobacteraceae bacterium]|nr:CoA pyrophosphatase [Geobacteraceae bacterium]
MDCPRPDMITLADIKLAFDVHKPDLLAGGDASHAAVALILREERSGLDMLFIERARHDNDPWSGNVGFPGGKVEKSDGDARNTAERETLEEIGIDLRGTRFLGRLSDIAGAHMPIWISCFVYGVGAIGPPRLSEEVGDAFWVPLDELFDPSRYGEFSVRFDGRTLIRPGIRLPQPGKPILWGITYRLVMQFRDILPAIDAGHSNGHYLP